MWYTGADQDWGDIRIVRDLDVPADAKLWMQNNYVIEEDWDFGFVEVSTDGGTTWTELKVSTRTAPRPPRPTATPTRTATWRHSVERGRGKQYGLTGSSNGWKHQYVDLAAYAGSTVSVRLRLATDAAFQERGWFADDFDLQSAGTTVWSDDVEGGDNGWENRGRDVRGDDRPRLADRQRHLHQRPVLPGRVAQLRRVRRGPEVRLRHRVQRRRRWKVDKIKYNAPGALVWYRDTGYGSTNHVESNETALPSAGAKGGLLIVDSHFDPLRRTGEAAEIDPTATDNMPSRAQSSNAAFGLTKTYPFTECITGAELTDEYCTDVKAQKPVSIFTDNQGWVPGIEIRNGEDLYYRYRNGSVVVPSVGNSPYTTRVVDENGTPPHRVLRPGDHARHDARDRQPG